MVAILIFATVPAAWGARREVGKSARKEAARYRFTIVENAAFTRNLKGKNIPVQEMEHELLRFFAALDELGVSFVKKSGLKRVMICRDLTSLGKPVSGVAGGDCIYLRAGFSKKTVYHEVYHLLDPEREDTSWIRLNHKKFRYKGIDHPQRPMRRSDKRKIEQHQQKYSHIDFAADFVSGYAQSNEREDRAETFSHMVNDSKRFMQKARRSPVLWRKMQYMIDMTSRKSLLGKTYWQRKLGAEAFGKYPGTASGKSK